MGFFSMDKHNTTSNAFDNRQDRRQVATDSGQNTGQGNVARTSGLNNTTIGGAAISGLNLAGGTGANSNVLGQGALQVSGKGQANFDIQSVDKDVIAAFGSTLGDILKGQQEGEAQRSSSLADLLSGQSTQSSSLLENIGKQLSSLAENKQTDGESGKNKIVLIVVVAVLALVAFIFWRRR